MSSSPWLAWSLLGLATGCTTTPLAPVPHPLPETLAWASEPDANGANEANGASGAYLGLKTRENLVGGFDELDFRPGLYVTRVVENSPAARAGCRAGDVLLSLDAHATDDPASLETLLADGTPGARALLEVQRGDTVFEVPVVLGALGEGATGSTDAARVKHRLDPARSRAAWLTGRGGAVLVASHEDAPFPRAGIEVGSVVRAVDGEEVLSDRALIRRLERYEPGAKVAVDYVTPQGEERRARVTLQDQPTKVTRVSLPVLFTYDADVEGERTSFVLIDLWILSLFRFERRGEERLWRFLRFIEFSSGVGELTE